MLPSLDDYVHARNLRYQFFLSKDTVDQRILQSDWTTSTTSNTQPKMAPQMLPFFDDYLHAKNLRDRLIPLGYIYDQRKEYYNLIG